MIISTDNPAPDAKLPVRIFSLQEQPGDDLGATTTAEERVAMIWRLTLDAWAMAGRSIPQYQRDQAPIRIVTLAEHRAQTGS